MRANLYLYYSYMLTLLPNFHNVRLATKDLVAAFLSFISRGSLETFFTVLAPTNLVKLFVQKFVSFDVNNYYKILSLNLLDNSVAANSLKFNNTTSNLIKLLANEETLNNHRGLRFNHPVFCYDYRAGDYFPKFYQENITYLLPTFAKITGGTRTPVWFLSERVPKVMEINLEGFFDVKGARKLRKKFFVSARSENRSSPTFFFYNFFSAFSKAKSKTPFY